MTISRKHLTILCAADEHRVWDRLLYLLGAGRISVSQAYGFWSAYLAQTEVVS